MRSFQEQQFFEFSSFAKTSKNQNKPPKRDETPTPSFSETRFLPSPEKTEARYIEKNFRRFIENLDRIDFRDLSPAQIQSLKDSLNHYADYIAEITKDNNNLRQSTDFTNYLKAAKELAEKEKKLLETEKELVKSELQNQNKTIIIASLSIILLILSGWVYYYVYVNRKIRSQAGELNKRNHFIEFLLRELNHRVTNNLQVISSMLRRKMRRLPDDKARLALQEINKRVIDISAIHVGLYSKNDAELITLDHYLRNLTKTLEKLYTFEQKPVHILIDSPALPIAHKNAVFFGLIINELVTNSLKYAFPDTDEPRINISIHKPKPQLFAVQVRDNGKGLPPDFNLEEAKSSGLKLVNLITQMLDGTFKMSNEQGSKFELTLKLS
ncbi:MAG: hypothetical protein HC913_17620 [Microscillaceae bacterium]|nr:hypothetical protein [Microscillaceae bacterium]